MKYKISKYFAKEVHKIKDRKILAKIKNCIDAIEKATDLADIPNLETLKGFPGYYRIKFDYRYRIGIFLNDETVEILKVESREGFYKNLP